MALQSWLACSVLLGGSVSAQGGPKYYLELEGALTPRSVAYVWDAATGDIDGDGDIDVVVGGERNGNVNPSLPRGSAVQVWINDRGRALVDETTGRITGQPSKALQVLLADVDGDKDLDCVTVPGPRLWINDGKGSFAPRSMTLSPGSESQALLVDVDGDKDLDCVAIPGPRLWINDGKGGFTSKMIPSPGGPLAHCVTGDIDGDSDADLVITLGLIHIGRGVFRATRLAVLINDGKGGFSISSKAPTELVGTRRLHLADFDGDLDLDIFCTSVGSGNSYATRNLLFVNDGKGGFTASSSFPDHQALELARVADLDRDGDLDIICRQTNSSSSQVFLWRNDAKNLFVNRGRLTNRTDATFAPVVADLDRDGDLDVVLSWDSMYGDDPAALEVLLGDGKAGFTAAGRGPKSPFMARLQVVFDFDGDGISDLLLVGKTATVLRGDGRGGFSEPVHRGLPYLPRVSGGPLAYADLDGDGDIDVLRGSAMVSSGNVRYRERLFLNDGRGGFEEQSAGLPRFLAATTDFGVGDFDKDGRLDILLSFSSAADLQPRQFRANGPARFVDVTATTMPLDRQAALDIEVGDVDRDGDLDAVLLTGSSLANRLYLNDGKGSFTLASSSRLPAAPAGRKVRMADVDGDSDPDLVYAGIQTRLHLNDGRGRFQDATTRLPRDSDTTNALTIEDFDRDGDADIFLANGHLFSPEQNRLYLNDGSGKFSDATATHLPKASDSSYWAAAGDIDLDGDLDLVVTSYLYNTPHGWEPSLLLNDGRGRFTVAPVDWRPRDFTVAYDDRIALADVDLDGDLDLFVGDMLYRNTYRHLHAPRLARVGKAFAYDLYARPGYATFTHLALPFLATTAQKTWIPPFGTFGLDLSKTVILAPLVILPPAGKTTLSLAVPNDVRFTGIPLFSQVLMSDLGYPPYAWRLTNVEADRIIR